MKIARLKRVENTVCKAEIARCEQFLLTHSISKGLYYRHIKTRKKAENKAGEGQNAGKHQFLLFSQYFLQF